MVAPNGTPEPPVPATEAPATETGRRLLSKTEALNARAFPLVTAEEILAIEAEARAAQQDRVAALEAMVLSLTTLVHIGFLVQYGPRRAEPRDVVGDLGPMLFDILDATDTDAAVRALLAPPAPARETAEPT